MNSCLPIDAAIIGAIAKTNISEMRINDCTKAKVLPRTSSSTSMPKRVCPVTSESPAKAPTNTVISMASTIFVERARIAKNNEDAVRESPKMRLLENCPKILGPSHAPSAKPENTEANKIP